MSAIEIGKKAESGADVDDAVVELPLQQQQRRRLPLQLDAE
jgi:hypothetical protein